MRRIAARLTRVLLVGQRPVENTRVSFRLEPDGEGTRVLFEHSGFGFSDPFGEQAFKGAEYGWAKMLKQLAAVVAGLATDSN
jgi:uncharacterized protein YndB with AHSA1/START domain